MFCKLKKRSTLMLLIIAFVSILSFKVAFAAPRFGDVIAINQPDGTRVEVKVYGDEFYNVLESLDGYTLTVDPKTSFVCYANLSRDGKSLISTGVVYKGTENNNRNSSFDNIKSSLNKGLRIIKSEENKIIQENIRKFEGKPSISENGPVSAFGASSTSSTQSLRSPNSVLNGDVTGLTIFVDFNDDIGTIHSQDLKFMLNLYSGYDDFGSNGSVREYFLNVSGNEIDYWNSTPNLNPSQHAHCKVFGYYRAKNNKSYYAASYDRARELVEEALKAVKSNSYFSNLTQVNGKVAAVNLWIAGYGHGGLWPHQWEFENDLVIDGYRFKRYQITDIQDEPSIGTFIHENGHLIFDWPDLYDRTNNSIGVGDFCIMATGGHYASGNQLNKNPVPPNPYFRMMQGWGSTTNLQTTTFSSLQTIHMAANSLNTYTYKLANDSELFMFENIKKEGRWANGPGEGLLVWHIDNRMAKVQNDNPQMSPNHHYYVSVKQADGNFDLENYRNFGQANDYFNRMSSGLGASFTYDTVPNTKWWNGDESGFHMTNIARGFSDILSLDFRRISSHPLILESWENMRWNRYVDWTLYQWVNRLEECSAGWTGRCISGSLEGFPISTVVNDQWASQGNKSIRSTIPAWTATMIEKPVNLNFRGYNQLKVDLKTDGTSSYAVSAKLVIRNGENEYDIYESSSTHISPTNTTTLTYHIPTFMTDVRNIAIYVHNGSNNERNVFIDNLRLQ